ncbi:MAG: hypothetical protein UX81_C0030G0003 [Parcubacteria group bacterium GW2011_GWA2_47_12]|nr:MAG: hypothetical protein UX81_C0030G0003 [Parcubacteria group bacterium GW2011_GWA2_47_12]
MFSFDFYQTAYLSAGIFYMLIWLVFYLLRKDLHRQMLIVGLFLIGTAPINVIWHGDYWSPPYIFGELFRFEDFFWGFAFAGVAAVAYKVIFASELKLTQPKSFQSIAANLFRVLFLIIFPLVVLTNIFHINSIYSISIGLIFALLYMYRVRPDLIYDMLWSGLFSFIFILVFYIIWQYPYPEVFYRFWKLDAISGIMLLGIPVEELVWFFLAGAFIGPLYEFITGATVVRCTK